LETGKPTTTMQDAYLEDEYVSPKVLSLVTEEKENGMLTGMWETETFVASRKEVY
jgi:hypothetical protein